MLQQDNIDLLKRKQLEKEIKEYVILRDKINKNLKREGWRLNKHLILKVLSPPNLIIPIEFMLIFKSKAECRSS